MDIRPLTELADYRARQTPPLSRSALADQIGVSRAAVSRWEAGKRRPDKRLIPLIAELTGVSPLELAGLD